MKQTKKKTSNIKWENFLYENFNLIENARLRNIYEKNNIIEKFTKNRDVKVEINNMLEENINGMYISNMRTCKINTKARQPLEFVIVHEMLHDMQGSKEYREIHMLVHEYAKDKTGYKEAYEELKNTYLKYYKKHKLSKRGLNIKIEATNDIVATVLGNQLYLNELINKKLNVFQKIIKWIKELKTNILGTEEKRFVQALKKKFENAYNSEYIRQGRYNKYSIQQDEQGIEFVKVDTDQNIFEGIEEKDYSKVAKMYMQDYLKGTTVLDKNEEARIGSKGINKYTAPSQRTKYIKEKMKLSIELKNVLKIARKIDNALPNKDTSKFPNWVYYTIFFEIRGVLFEGLVNIGVDKKGNKHFYEINKIHTTSKLHISASKSSDMNSINNTSIPNNNTNVNI